LLKSRGAQGSLLPWCSPHEILSPKATPWGQQALLEILDPGIQFRHGVGDNVFEMIKVVPHLQELLTYVIDALIGDHGGAP
jgi:hypothetical protein